jgi:solute carrier family 6 GABA transporter-like protein 1
LRRDLNVVVGRGKNWKLPFWWPALLRYLSAPILAIIFSFGYPNFYKLRNDPLHIFGFATAHIALVIVGLGVIVPRWFDVLIPTERRNDGEYPYAPCETIERDAPEVITGSRENDSETIDDRKEVKV